MASKQLNREAIFMTERFKLSLSGIWLLASLSALIFPIFVPSFPGATGLFGNPIWTATATMFILSFPTSLLGFPLTFLADMVLGLDPNSIRGMYLNVLILLVLGLVQWFWMVPRLLKSEAAERVFERFLPEVTPAARPEGTIDTAAEFFDAKETTPLERVLRDSD
jgi:hypothetical protein